MQDLINALAIFITVVAIVSLVVCAALHVTMWLMDDDSDDPDYDNL